MENGKIHWSYSNESAKAKSKRGITLYFIQCQFNQDASSPWVSMTPKFDFKVVEWG
jgi:hypothetical protein